MDAHSYHPLLLESLTKLQGVKTSGLSVLEWGSGQSTELIRHHLKQGSIISVEHDARFTIPSTPESPVPFRQLFRKTQRPYGASQDYVTCVADHGPFDFILVDGRNRTDCLAMASWILAPDGMVMLHDAERTDYHDGFRWFKKKIIITTGPNLTAILEEPTHRLALR